MEQSYVASNGTSINQSSVNDNLLTVAEVAQRLHAHPHSVRRWADAGLLNCYRIGVRGDRRFQPEDVDAFLVAKSDGQSGNGLTEYEI